MSKSGTSKTKNSGTASGSKELVRPFDGHYKFIYKGIKIDPYRIMTIYGITHPAQQHALKKLLRAGRSVKNLQRDIAEVQMALTRWMEMEAEDEREGQRKT